MSKSTRIITGARLHVMWAITATIAEAFITIIVTTIGIPIFEKYTTNLIAIFGMTVIIACIMRRTAVM